MLLSEAEGSLLDRLAEHEQATSSDVLRGLLRREAKRVLGLAVADVATRRKAR